MKNKQQPIDINVYADALHTLKVCKLPPAMNILDIGAGSGSFVKKYPFVGAKITFLDKSDNESGSFDTLCKKLYVGGRFSHVTGMADDLSMFDDDCFDMVVLLQVLEHIPVDCLDKCMREIRRVLKPEGFFVMSTPNRIVRKLVGKYLANENHVQEFSNDELLQLYKCHGFVVLENEGILKVADGKVWLNEGCCSPDVGYFLWVLATK